MTSQGSVSVTLIAFPHRQHSPPKVTSTRQPPTASGEASYGSGSIVCNGSEAATTELGNASVCFRPIPAISGVSAFDPLRTLPHQDLARCWHASVSSNELAGLPVSRQGLAGRDAEGVRPAPANGPVRVYPRTGPFHNKFGQRPNARFRPIPRHSLRGFRETLDAPSPVTFR